VQHGGWGISPHTTFEQEETMSKDPVVLDEIKHDRMCETAREVMEAQTDELLPKAWQEIDCGERDWDLATYFEPSLLLRIARNVTRYRHDPELAMSRVTADMIDMHCQLEDYARNMVKEWME